MSLAAGQFIASNNSLEGSDHPTIEERLTSTDYSVLQKSVQILNGLDSSKFPLLLARISQKLHLKDERAFTENEEEKLSETFQLPASDLERVIETCEFFLHQAAYHSLKPKSFGEQLTSIQVGEEKIRVFVETWSNCGKDVVENLRKRSLLPKQLESVNWSLNLQMSQASQSKMKEPNAQFELTLNNDHSKEKEKVRLELNHHELYSFYNQLETIQSQLDALS